MNTDINRTVVFSEYEDGLRDCEVARESHLEALANLWAAEKKAKEFEAEVIANGGYALINIDGKNAEMREAQTVLALGSHGPYQEAARSRTAAKIAVELFESERDNAIEHIRHARALLALIESENLLAAYTAGGDKRKEH